MKKTLIALTLAALPVAASADVILYGQIKGGVETTFSKKVGGEKVDGTDTAIVDYGSRIGFKGHEQLNSDLKAIWQLEQKVDIAGGATGTKVDAVQKVHQHGRETTNVEYKKGVNGFGTRDSFIGLESATAGTIKAGYLSTPVKDLNGKLDEWEYSSDVLGLGHFTRSSDANRRAVAVSYTTPNMAGFSASAYASPSDNNAGTPNAQNAGRDASTYGLSASYENSGFFADVAGTYVKNGANNGTLSLSDSTGKPFKEKKAYQALGQVGYDNGNVLAGVAYQRSQHVNYEYDVANEVAATVAYKATPSLRLKGTAAYGFEISDRKGKPAYGNGKYYQGIIGADYELSKRTQLNGQVGYIQAGKGDEKTQAGSVGVGLKHKF